MNQQIYIQSYYTYFSNTEPLFYHKKWHKPVILSYTILDYTHKHTHHFILGKLILKKIDNRKNKKD